MQNIGTSDSHLTLDKVFGRIGPEITSDWENQKQYSKNYVVNSVDQKLLEKKKKNVDFFWSTC